MSIDGRSTAHRVSGQRDRKGDRGVLSNYSPADLPASGDIAVSREGAKRTVIDEATAQPLKVNGDLAAMRVRGRDGVGAIVRRASDPDSRRCRAMSVVAKVDVIPVERGE